MSNRIMAVLMIFYRLRQNEEKEGKIKYLATLDGLVIDQRSFVAVLEYRKYVSFIKGRGFRITPLGVSTVEAWNDTVVIKENPSTKFALALQKIAGLNGDFNREPTATKKAKIYRMAAS